MPEAEYDAYDANGDNDLLQAGKGIRNNIEVCYEHDHDSKCYEVKVTESQTTYNLSLIRWLFLSNSVWLLESFANRSWAYIQMEENQKPVLKREENEIKCEDHSFEQEVFLFQQNRKGVVRQINGLLSLK